jgi:hypothetical protein
MNLPVFIESGYFEWLVTSEESIRSVVLDVVVAAADDDDGGDIGGGTRYMSLTCGHQRTYCSSPGDIRM